MGNKKKRTLDRSRHHSQPLPRGPTPTTDKALATHELLELILSHVDAPTLLVSCQRVCTRWQGMIVQSPLLQQVLFLKPSTRRPAVDCPCDGGPYAQVLNPFLWRHFRALFHSAPGVPGSDDGPRCEKCGNMTGFGSWDLAALRPGSLSRGKDKLSFADAGRDRWRQKAFMRAGASWRRMLITQPPILEAQHWTEWRGDRFIAPSLGVRETVSTAEFPEGLRMGQLYDLVFSVLFAQRIEDGHWVTVRSQAPENPSAHSPTLVERRRPGDADRAAWRLSLHELYYLHEVSACDGGDHWHHGPMRNEHICKGGRLKYMRNRRRTSTEWMFRCEEFVDGFRDFGTSLEERRLFVEEKLKLKR